MVLSRYVINMKPITTIEGKDVFHGSVLYSKTTNEQVVIGRCLNSDPRFISTEEGGTYPLISSLTWEVPQTIQTLD